MSNKLIFANWKENPQSAIEANKLFTGILKESKNFKKNVSVIICPPYPFISLFSKIKNKKLQLGAQDVSQYTDGAHTSHVSSSMLSSIRVSYAIVGHSECRNDGDTDEIINTKIMNLLKSKITPVLCVGESVRDSGGEYLNFVKNQIHKSLLNLNKVQTSSVVIAYEPIWAIGSKALRECSTDEFIEMRIFIRKVLSDMYDNKTASNLSIIYGGSVHKENASSFIIDGGSDGLLVGRDSLDIKKFKDIIYAIN